MQTITAKYSNTKIYDWHIVCLSITGLSSSLLFFIPLDSKVRSAHKASLKVEIHVGDARRRLHELPERVGRALDRHREVLLAAFGPSCGAVLDRVVGVLLGAGGVDLMSSHSSQLGRRW